LHKFPKLIHSANVRNIPLQSNGIFCREVWRFEPGYGQKRFLIVFSYQKISSGKDETMSERTKKYLESRRELLVWLEAMWQDPKVQCYNDAEMPTDDFPSVFLNGPTSRGQILEFNHRYLSVKFLRGAGFKDWIYVPEPRGQEDPGDFTEKAYIHNWESSRRLTATCNSFWIPRDSGELLGLNTNFEWGCSTAQAMFDQQFQKDGRSVVVGWPEYAERMGLPKHYSEEARLPIFGDQKEMCDYIAKIMQK